MAASWTSLREGLARFGRGESGLAAIELAFALPILLVLAIGCYDTARLILLGQKLDRVVSSMSDIISQPEETSAGEISGILGGVDDLMSPFPLSTEGVVIVTSVSRPVGNAARINWQCRGGGSGTEPSRIGVPGGTPVLPAGFTLREGESLVVAEAFYDFEPVFDTFVLPADTLYNVAIRRPRRSDLTSIDGSCS